MALLTFHSVTVVSSIRASSEMSPAMLWPMWIVYSVMLIGFGLAVLRGIQQTVLHILHFNDKGLSTVEQAMEEAKEETELAKGGND
jgi:TRAP-type C4-dicarboxylate transport system permease small subunit